MIHCASLVYFKQDKILLARIRDNKLWYFPGGKISEGESPAHTLSRELFEELDIAITPDEMLKLTEVIAPSHDLKDTVYLYIYTISHLPIYRPKNEVKELKFFSLSDTELMAPAVIETIRILKK